MSRLYEFGYSGLGDIALKMSIRNVAAGMILCAGLILSGCAKSGTPDATQQTATVKLKDGGTFSGSVNKSDNSAITLTSANGESRTYPMSQVQSVKYDTAPAPDSSSASTSAAPSAPMAPTAAPPPTRRDSHYPGFNNDLSPEQRQDLGTSRSGWADLSRRDCP